MPGGDFENPKGNPAGPRAGAEAGERSEATNGGRSGGPRARRGARGVFKIPDGLRGSGQNPRKQNPNFVYIFVVLIILLKQKFYKTLSTLTS